ncbi:MAG: guanylate kinase [Chloroflexi bacterium]|nr:guanylate kinase [Chloroflexota bacterium]
MTTPQRRQGLIFVLVGPPGVGKNALMNVVLNRVDNLRQLPTATTRAPRPNEQQGREHLFVTRDEFQQLIDSKALIEWQVVHGELYGMPRATVEEAIAGEHDLIADIDVLGATYLRSLYPDNAVLIFIQPPSLDELKKRMETRGERPEEIAKRLRRVDMEMQYAPLCDYLITNAVLEDASEILYAIVLAERSRSALLNLRVERHLPRRKFTFATTVIPVHGGEVLCHDGDPPFPTAPLTHGEFPHDAALRAIQQELGIAATEDLLAFGKQQAILPVALDTAEQSHFQQFIFVYLYLLPQRITPPERWQWIPGRQAKLPPAVLDVILNDHNALTPERS